MGRRARRIEPRPGGAVHIRFPNAIVAGGEVVEIVPPESVVFSYGFESGQPIPIGASRVTITLEETPRGTLVKLHHELPNAEVRDEHVQGWRYQLAVFANVVAREAHAGAGVARRPLLRLLGRDRRRRRRSRARRGRGRRSWRSAIPTPARPASTTSIAHIAASQRFMPGIVLARQGEPRQCQGAGARRLGREGPGRDPRARGTNVFELDEGRPHRPRVTGFWVVRP